VSEQKAKNRKVATVLVIEDTVIVRMAISGYLRECGYKVIEAATSDEALIVLEQPQIAVHVIFNSIDAAGAMDAFALAQWVRKNRPELKTIMVSSPKTAAGAAGRLCEEGPHFRKPYDPQTVEEYIRRLLAPQRSTEPQ
jgi:DNA-binding NtrC family response regulator